jgi:hypothetical protein
MLGLPSLPWQVTITAGTGESIVPAFHERLPMFII